MSNFNNNDSDTDTDTDNDSDNTHNNNNDQNITPNKYHCVNCKKTIDCNMGRFCKECRKEKYDKYKKDLEEEENYTDDYYDEYNDQYNDQYNDEYNDQYNDEFNEDLRNKLQDGFQDDWRCINCNQYKDKIYHKYCRDCYMNYNDYYYVFDNFYDNFENYNQFVKNQRDNYRNKNTNKNTNQNTNTNQNNKKRTKKSIRNNNNTNEEENKKNKKRRMTDLFDPKLLKNGIIIEFELNDDNPRNRKKNKETNDKENCEIIDLISTLLQGDSRYQEISSEKTAEKKKEENIELEAKKYDNPEFEYKGLGDDINNLNELINLGKSFDKETKHRHNLNLYKLNKLVEPLEELNNMIGLKEVKQSIFDQIIYYLQGLDDKNNDMLHSVIQGPPGVGKTKLCNILAKIYKGFGFLKNSNVISVKRDDLIAGYLGQTAIKTKAKIEEALGGVLFIDEAYSLGSEDGKDSFSKEAIDLLTSYLSEHPHDLVCIIAGYKNALDKCFFKQNEGLRRRFTQVYDISGYDDDELRKIFFSIVKDNNWKIDEENIKTDIFKENKPYFLFNGGDMLNVFSCCKKAHAKRLLKISTNEKELNESKKKITKEDLLKGIELFIKNPEIKKRNDKTNKNSFLMYT